MSRTTHNEKPPEPGSEGASVNNTRPPHCAYFLSSSPDWRDNSPAWSAFVETTFLAALDVYPSFINDTATKPMRCAVCGATPLRSEGELLPIPHLPKAPELLPSVLMAVCAPCILRRDFEAMTRAGDNVARTIKKERGLF